MGENSQDSANETDIPIEHACELDRRFAAYVANPEDGFSLEAVEAMLKARRQIEPDVKT